MNKNRLATLAILPLLTCSAYGQVCVSPVNPNSGDRGLVLPPPGHPDFGKMPSKQYFVQIDNGPRLEVSKVSGTMLQVNNRRKQHSFRVYRDGKQVHSFRFLLSSRGDRKCIFFRPLYETWSIKSVTSLANCGCQKGL